MKIILNIIKIQIWFPHRALLAARRKGDFLEKLTIRNQKKVSPSTVNLDPDPLHKQHHRHHCHLVAAAGDFTTGFAADFKVLVEKMPRHAFPTDSCIAKWAFTIKLPQVDSVLILMHLLLRSIPKWLVAVCAKELVSLLALPNVISH